MRKASDVESHVSEDLQRRVDYRSSAAFLLKLEKAIKLFRRDVKDGASITTLDVFALREDFDAAMSWVERLPKYKS